jgi:hypothetical protein
LGGWEENKGRNARYQRQCELWLCDIFGLYSLVAEAVNRLALFVADQAVTTKKQSKQLVSVDWMGMEIACLDHVAVDCTCVPIIAANRGKAGANKGSRLATIM